MNLASRAVHEQVQGRYDFDSGGFSEVKGKGPIETLLLRGATQAAEAPL